MKKNNMILAIRDSINESKINEIFGWSKAEKEKVAS